MALPILRRGGSPVPVRRSDDSTNAISRVDPWSDFEVMDRLFDNFFRSPFSLFGRNVGQAMAPAESHVELYETGDDLWAYIYAPGLSADAFDITLSGDVMTIKGERKPLLEQAEGLMSHTPWGGLATTGGTFTASYNLPVEVDAAKVEAHYKDGVLQIRLPKSETAKPKQVKVQVSK